MKNLLITAFVFFPLLNLAQNLLPDPSFEDTIKCPDSTGPENFLMYWSAPTYASGYYFNSCNNGLYGVPQNFYGIQPAHEGSGYLAIATHALTGNLRYYVETELLETLLPNKKYLVQFYVSLADSAGYGCDDIGVYFSDTALHDWQTENNLPFIPQIENQQGNSLASTTSWTLVSDTFTANGTEKFLTIGNFKSDTFSIIYPVSGGAPWSTGTIYYVDDLIVQQFSGEDGTQNVPGQEIKIFSLPTNSIVTIELQTFIESLTLFSTDGKLLRHFNDLHQSKFDLEVDDLSNGIYFVEVTSGNKIYRGKILVAH